MQPPLIGVIMTTSNANGRVEVKVLRAKKLPKLGRSPFDDKFRVELSLGDQAFRTETKRRSKHGFGSSVLWDESIELAFISPMPDLTLEVFGQDSDKEDIFIGRTVVPYATLSSSGRPKIGINEDRDLQLSGSSGKPVSEATTLAVSIKIISLGDVEPIDDLRTTSTLKEASCAIQLEAGEASSISSPELNPSLNQAAFDAGESVREQEHLTPIGRKTDATPSETKVDIHPTIIDSNAVENIASHTEATHSAVILSEASIALAVNDSSHLHRPNFPGVPQLTGVDGDTLSPAGNLAIALLNGVEAFAQLVDVVSEIHPYAKAAWSILNFGRQVVKAQIQQDTDLQGLADQMKLLFERVRRVVDDGKGGPSTIQKRHHDILLRVARQANNCAYFIVDYCKDKNFRTRVIKRIGSDKQSKIEEYRSAFTNLAEELEGRVQDHTQMVATLVWQDVRELDKKIDELKATALVDKLKTVDGASLVVSGTSPKRCLPGTRVDILNEITDWINQVREGSQGQRLLLLHGMAGTGKSSIAHTIASQFAGLGRLGASFAFSRGSNSRRVSQLFPHIARLLINLDPTLGLKHHLAAILDNGDEILASADPALHFEKFILEPLRKVAITGSVAIVVDAADEAPDEANVTNLTSLLVSCCVDLPPNVRILVTSRPEAYDASQIQIPAVFPLSMPSSSDTTSDVGVFIRAQLLHLHLKGITAECCDTLVVTSQGVFQWAATACKEIIGDRVQMGSTPLKRYEMVVESGRGRDKSGLLDSLYDDVLRRACNPDTNPDGHQLMKRVIAALFAMMEPVTLDAFRQLYKKLEFGEESDVDCTLPYLASILDGTSDTDRTRHVQPNHISLRDFLLDPKRSGPFCVKDLLPAAHDRAARSSFSIVSTSLRQDTSTLDFSRRLDDDGYLVSEADRLQREMPPDVEYACLYCAKHLAKAPMPEESFWIGLEKSFLSDNHALLWIEVFCLLVIHRVRAIYMHAPYELSGCMGLLAHIMRQQGSSCPRGVRFIAEHASTILSAKRSNRASQNFYLLSTLVRLGQVYSSVAWTVKLQQQSKDGSLVTVGNGFFLDLRCASHDVILTTAHDLLDANGHPRTDLIINIPDQVPRLDGALQFYDDQFPVLPTDIHVCADFSQRQQLETDWGAIRLPRSTALEEGFWFNVELEDPNSVAVATYGKPSWTTHSLHLPVNDSNDSNDDMPTTASPTDAEAASLGDPVASGGPVYAFNFNDIYWSLYVRGIWNPIYGDTAYTKLTPAVTRELDLWLGVTTKSDVRLRWRPPTQTASQSWDNLYLYVNEEEDSSLYFKHGSGSSFDVSFPYIASSFEPDSGLLGFGSMLVVALDEDTEGGPRLACVCAWNREERPGLTVMMTQHADFKGLETPKAIITLDHASYFFDVESIPNADSELFKINLGRQREVEEGSIRFDDLTFALE